MPNAIHIDKWLQRAEPDYYSMFINAWIPFNAWYVKEYKDKHDRTCLNQIYSNPNKLKNKIKSYLDGDSDEAIRFRYNIAQLQAELLKHPLPDESPINFGNVLTIDNPKTVAQENFSIYKIKWEYIKGGPDKCKCIVTHKTKNTTKATINLAEWNELELSNNGDFISIDNRRIQDKVIEYFQQIKPRINRSIIKKERPFRGAIVIDKRMSLYFVNDKELICQAIIEMLYQLRCMIFHGNIDPTKACGSVYEYAFNIQRELIKELV